jgi:Cu/Ag efflux protein CusF
MKIRLGIASLATSLVATLAFADSPPTHIRGTIAGLDGSTLTVTTKEGPTVAINLPDKVRLNVVNKTDISAIKPGTFIGTAAQPGPDGELRAMEVVVFPEAARGTGEGHYDWDLAPGTSMTNANVDAAVESASGRELTLSYKGGSVKIVVPPDVPMVTPSPAAMSDLKPGEKVFVIARKADDGTTSAIVVVVGKDGVAPPM